MTVSEVSLGILEFVKFFKFRLGVCEVLHGSLECEYGTVWRFSSMTGCL